MKHAPKATEFPQTVLGYAGEYRDPVLGGYPLGNGYRVYLPHLMRFMAPDSMSPFGRGGPNPYAYCENDPINRCDPSGHLGFFEALHQATAFLRRVPKGSASVAGDLAAKVDDEAIAAARASADAHTKVPLQKSISAPGRTSSPPRPHAASKSKAARAPRLHTVSESTPTIMKHDSRQLLHGTIGSIMDSASWGTLPRSPTLGGYVSSVDSINQMADHLGWTLTDTTGEQIRENVMAVAEKTELASLASVSESRNFALDAVNPSLSPKSRRAASLGKLANKFLGPAFFLEEDRDSHRRREFSGEQQTVMNAFEAGNSFD